MCLIIDSNRFHVFFNERPDADTTPIYRWLKTKNGKLVYTNFGKFSKEIKKSKNVQQTLNEYYRAGKAKLILKDAIEKEMRVLQGKSLKSNDVHIIALALASNTTLLYTSDGKLQKDFKDPRLGIKKGRIYKNKKHEDLLKPDTCS